ncbi:YybH family protein [Candidatus Palauibacter sp.]|uniref:YybH family protein n=1 Tax=Candidatus Palauibacter sp. TaxID=3101350 RepID=UPI003B026AD3
MSLLLALAGGVPAAAVAQDDEHEIIDTLVAMWAAIEAGDLDAYAQYVHPDFAAFGESDVYLAEGRALELRSYEDYPGRARDVHTEMHQPRVTIRGDVAWITYYWTDSGRIGEERFTSRGKSTRIFVREGGRWLCIHGHYTAVP